MSEEIGGFEERLELVCERLGLPKVTSINSLLTIATGKKLENVYLQNFEKAVSYREIERELWKLKEDSEKPE